MIEVPAGDDARALVVIRRLLHTTAELAFTEVYASVLIRQVIEDLQAEHPDLRLTVGGNAIDTSVVVNLPDEEERLLAAERAISAGADRELAVWVALNGTAVVLDIPGERPGRTLGFRFDIDALPITESSSDDHLPAREGFACTDGVMHACGHDGHTAIGLVLARRLASDRDFAGTVRLIFQPAEESVRGGVAMVAAGMAEGIDDFVGLHLGEGLAAGVIAASAEKLQATVKYEAEFTGVAAHSAGAPERGRNAIAAASSAVLGLLGTARDARGRTTVNVGRITGGAGNNIIPEHAWLSGEVRSDVTEVCDDLFERAGATIAGAGDMWGVATEVKVTSRCPTFTADASLVDEVVAAADGVADVLDVQVTTEMNASDDLAVWALETQRQGGRATYTVVGCSSPASHHHPAFDVDERVLPIACDWLERIVRAGGR